MSAGIEHDRLKDSVAADSVTAPGEDLLETLKNFRAATGDGLDDEEFTFFMLERQKDLPAESGFRFLCFHEGCATLSVPRQDAESWRAAGRWMSLNKEAIAVRLAEKYGFMLSEPPDATLTLIVPNGFAVRHHLEFSNRKETIIVAHPEYLKIRLYASDNGLIFPRAKGLLQDLAELYAPALPTDLSAAAQTD